MKRRDQRGSVLVELTWLAVLLLIPLVWIAVSVFEVQRGAFALSGAARAAGRAFVLAPDDATGRARALTATRQVLADHGIGDTRFDLEIHCETSNCHTPGTLVEIRLRSSVVLPLLPPVLGGHRPRFALSASHAVPIGRYQEPG